MAKGVVSSQSTVTNRFLFVSVQQALNTDGGLGVQVSVICPSDVTRSVWLLEGEDSDEGRQTECPSGGMSLEAIGFSDSSFWKHAFRSGETDNLPIFGSAVRHRRAAKHGSHPIGQTEERPLMASLDRVPIDPSGRMGIMSGSKTSCKKVLSWLAHITTRSSLEGEEEEEET